MTREDAVQEIRNNWRYFYPPDKRKKGIVCPLCDNGKGSDGDGIIENPKARKRGGLICFKCGFKGDILDLLQQANGIDYNTAFNMAVDTLGLTVDSYSGSGQHTGSHSGAISKDTQKPAPLPDSVKPDSGSQDTPPGPAAGSDSTNDKKPAVISDSDVEPVADYTAFYKECRARLGSSAAVSYLQERGISPETAAKRGIGYDPSWVSPKAIKNLQAQGNDWMPPGTARIIIPVTKNHYVARAIYDDKVDKKYRKQNETGGGETGIFGWKELKKGHDIIFVTEGAFDALSIMEVGRYAVALNSTSNVGKFIKMLREQPHIETTFIICLDKDDSGKKATKVLREELGRLNISHIVADINGGFNDPNVALVNDRAGFIEAIEAAVRQAERRPDNVEYYINSVMGSDIARFKSDIKTGYANLDKQSGGLYSGLYVVAAISSLGKTTFCHQLADQIAAGGHDVLFFSMEQSRLEMVSKSLARKTAQKDINNAVTSLSIRKGYLPQSVRDAVKEYTEEVKDRLSIIEGNFACNITFIGEYIRQYIRRNETAQGEYRPVVFIDYLQILQPADDDDGRTPTARQIVDSTVTELKRISRELDLTIFIISSVNRANYLTPIDFESLKESGGIEYTADVIWGLQLQCLNDSIFDKANNIKERRQKVKEAKAATPRKIELVCLKNRYGISNYSCYFNYYPAADLFTECNGAELDFSEKPAAGHRNGARII